VFIAKINKYHIPWLEIRILLDPKITERMSIKNRLDINEQNSHADAAAESSRSSLTKYSKRNTLLYTKPRIFFIYEFFNIMLSNESGITKQERL
jgi:hypothetical protein